MTKVKLCGLRTETDANYVNKVIPDYAGVILAQGFKRTISLAQAKGIRAKLDASIPLVGVFVDSPMEDIVEAYEQGVIDIIQLHGAETEEFIEKLKKELTFFMASKNGDSLEKNQILEKDARRNFYNSKSFEENVSQRNQQVFSLANNEERNLPPIWKVFQMKNVDETLLERIETSSADMVLLDAGTGAGEKFDWSATKQIKRGFILAGGLTPENVAEAIKQTHPYAVDVSSGVETDGAKDFAKMQKFVAAVRSYNR